jgi:hypothetical protein
VPSLAAEVPSLAVEAPSFVAARIHIVNLHITVRIDSEISSSFKVTTSFPLVIALPYQVASSLLW